MTRASTRRALTRIAAGAAITFGCAACDALFGNGDAPAAAPTSRFEAVAPKATGADALAGFCDVRAEPGQGKSFAFPKVASGAPAAPAASSFMWLNLWATWCKPCVEEMPMIAVWQKSFAAQGTPLDIRFVSVDEDPQAVDNFRGAHPGMPDTLKLVDPKALSSYVAELGLDSGAGLPIHVFVEKGARIRCVRAGAVAESHHDIVASMLK